MTTKRTDDGGEALTNHARELIDAAKRPVLSVDQHNAIARMLNDRIRTLESENNLLRDQLLACGIAALQNTRQSDPPFPREHRVWSGPYQDVIDAVGREIQWREKAERAIALLQQVEWGRTAEHAYGRRCFECGRPEDIGHAPDCALAAALREGETRVASDEALGPEMLRAALEKARGER